MSGWRKKLKPRTDRVASKSQFRYLGEASTIQELQLHMPAENSAFKAFAKSNEKIHYG
jgi:hypothetical protein